MSDSSSEKIGNSLLQVVNGHVFEVNALSTIDIVGIGENADGHAGAGNVGEPGVSQALEIA